jgi:hypothetical protein
VNDFNTILLPIDRIDRNNRDYLTNLTTEYNGITDRVLQSIIEPSYDNRLREYISTSTNTMFIENSRRWLEDMFYDVTTPNGVRTVGNIRTEYSGLPEFSRYLSELKIVVDD